MDIFEQPVYILEGGDTFNTLIQHVTFNGSVL